MATKGKIGAAEVTVTKASVTALSLDALEYVVKDNPI